jgi:hypothetical protein
MLWIAGALVAMSGAFILFYYIGGWPTVGVFLLLWGDNIRKEGTEYGDGGNQDQIDHEALPGWHDKPPGF